MATNTIDFLSLSDLFPTIVGYLSVRDIAIFCGTCRSIYEQTPFLVTEWASWQEDIVLKTKLFRLYGEKKLNYAMMSLIPRYQSARTVLDILLSYAQSQQTNIRHSKKEIIMSLRRRDLLRNLPTIFSCDPLMTMSDLMTPHRDEEGNELVPRSSGLTILYNLFIEPFCVFQEPGEHVDRFICSSVECMGEAISWLLWACSEYRMCDQFALDIIKLNIARECVY